MSTKNVNSKSAKSTRSKPKEETVRLVSSSYERYYRLFGTIDAKPAINTLSARKLAGILLAVEALTDKRVTPRFVRTLHAAMASGLVSRERQSAEVAHA